MIDQYSSLEVMCREVQKGGNAMYGDPEQILGMIADIRKLRGVLEHVRGADRMNAELEYEQYEQAWLWLKQVHARLQEEG